MYFQVQLIEILALNGWKRLDTVTEIRIISAYSQGIHER